MRDNGEIMIAENLYLNLDKLDSSPKEPYLIDTNIFLTVYTNVNPEDKSEKIRNYFNLLSEDNLKYGCISIQNLVEFVNVTKNKIKCFDNPAELNNRLKNISNLFCVLSYNSDTIMQAVDLSYSTGVHFFDALLAQTMLDNNIHLILTENTKDFNKIPGIKAINPFTDKKIARLCEKARKHRLKYQMKSKRKLD